MDDIKAKIEGETASTPSDVDSTKVVPSKTESPDSLLAQRPPKEVSSQEMSLSSLSNNPKRKHIEDTFVGRDISCQRSSSNLKQESSGEGRSSASPIPNQASASGVPALPTRTSKDAWHQTEQELTEYFSNVHIENGSRRLHHAATAELKRPPETLNDDSFDAFTRIWVGGGKSTRKVPNPLPPRGQELPQRLDRDRDDEEMDDRKPPANRHKKDDNL